MSAEYGNSCEGCGMLVAENWKGQTWFRCGADSQWKGYTVGIERLNPLVPAWCPEKEKKEK